MAIACIPALQDAAKKELDLRAPVAKQRAKKFNIEEELAVGYVWVGQAPCVARAATDPRRACAQAAPRTDGCGRRRWCLPTHAYSVSPPRYCSA